MASQLLKLQYAISTHDLTRCFGKLRAVDRLNMLVPTGVIFGFLGINGAGKTTTIKMLTTLLQPTAGNAMVLGHDVTTHPLEVKRQIGVLLEEDCLYDRLTGREHMEFVAAFHGLSNKETRNRTEELFESLDLSEKGNELIGTYSKGMRRKLAFASAMVHRPPLLILDEPFADVDALTIYHIKRLLSQLRDEGSTILLSSHWLGVVQDVYDLAAIIHRGHIVAVGDQQTLRRRAELKDTASLEEVFVQLVQSKQAVSTPVEV